MCAERIYVNGGGDGIGCGKMEGLRKLKMKGVSFNADGNILYPDAKGYGSNIKDLLDWHFRTNDDSSPKKPIDYDMFAKYVKDNRINVSILRFPASWRKLYDK